MGMEVIESYGTKHGSLFLGKLWIRVAGIGFLHGGVVKGGHLHETTKAWITIVQAICIGKKMGYTREEGKQAHEEEYNLR